MIKSPSLGQRLPAIDIHRGILMVLMALDHTALFVAKAHPFEAWGSPLPNYPSILAFLTRYVSHLCAPGFFLLLGIGMAFSAEKRRRQGWTMAQLTRHFVLRGLLLIVLEQLLENPAWMLSRLGRQVAMNRYAATLSLGDSGDVWVGLAVLYALGAALIIWGLLIRSSSLMLVLVSVSAILASHVITPSPEQHAIHYAVWLRLLFIPGQTDFIAVLYPAIPWLGISGVGIALGRLLRVQPAKGARMCLPMGLILIGMFLSLAFAGLGDPHQEARGWIGIFNLTKYPPSLNFICLTLGLNLMVLFVCFSYCHSLPTRIAQPLRLFGRTAIFFYLAHLYVYAIIGIGFPRGTSLVYAYPVWLFGLILMYFLCSGYERLRHSYRTSAGG
jgi:uncharacterized membrane protein